MIAWFMSTPIGRWAAGAIAGLLALVGVYLAGRQSGGSAARAKAKQRDATRALDIKEKADDALRDRDPARPVDERLHEHGRLRD